MVVKDKIGRQRYILFQIDSNNFVGKHTIITKLKKFPITIWLIELKNRYGIIRCKHTDKDKAIKLLNDLNSGIRTIVTTGSIKKARAIARMCEQ